MDAGPQWRTDCREPVSVGEKHRVLEDPPWRSGPGRPTKARTFWERDHQRKESLPNFRWAGRELGVRPAHGQTPSCGALKTARPRAAQAPALRVRSRPCGKGWFSVDPTCAATRKPGLGPHGVPCAIRRGTASQATSIPVFSLLKCDLDAEVNKPSDTPSSGFWSSAPHLPHAWPRRLGLFSGFSSSS